MKALAPLLLLAGCAAASPPAASLPPMEGGSSYICADGRKATLQRDQAAGLLRVERSGETYVLQEQVGVSPPRFVSGSDTIVYAENAIFLQRGKEVRQSCARVPDAPAAGLVWGTLAKLDRMALPPGTQAKVLLVDAARADAPAVELGSTRITTAGNQVPLHFLISYDPARTAAPARPMLQARIEDSSGRLLYITDTANPVPSDGPAPSPIALMLVAPGGK